MGGFVSKLFGGGGNNDAAMAQIANQQAEEARKAQLRAQIDALFGGDNAARFKAEEEELANALRANYGEELGTKYGESARALKFSAANSGGVGGSAYADKMGELDRDNALAGTRITEAIQRQINQLQSQREATRTNALNLVNTGSGAEAVSAATSGLNSSLNAAKSASRERLFDDLFQGLAVGAGAGNANAKNAAAAALYKQKTGAYFPTSPTDTGTVR